MKTLLDDETLDGAHEVRVTFRPERIAIPVDNDSMERFCSAVQYQCQIWGGATNPLIPVGAGKSIPQSYLKILGGAAIDAVEGLDVFGLFHSPEAKISRPVTGDGFGSQLAVALLEHGSQDNYRPLSVVSLESGDPWKQIYAACLGLLPENPHPSLLKFGYLRPDLRFQDFLNVNEVVVAGSLADLLARLTSSDCITPRKLSMIHLPYGGVGGWSIRAENEVLPQAKAAQSKAGPNVVVVCSPESVDDLSLLWNLRGAHGDSRPVPIGIPVAEASVVSLRKILAQPGLSENSFATRSIYVTSVSLSVDELTSMLGDTDGLELAIASGEEMLAFGRPGGWARDEVLVWKNGSTRFVPLPDQSHREIFEDRALGELTRTFFDFEVLDSPFPQGDDIRVDAPSNTFYAGKQTGWGSARNRSDIREISWPSSLLMAKSVAFSRGLELRESEPGRAGRLALTSLGDIGFVGRLAHAPLLAMLEEMAARQGFGWYKQRLRDAGEDANPIEAVGPTTDELPERSFGEFKKVLGDSDKATRFWLLWAEQSKLVVKGFHLKCSACFAQQWVPIPAFSPPIVCRGCAEEMHTPFGDRQSVQFTYRLSERLRRVYEQDAMGHLLVARYFHVLFHGFRTSRLVGLHPGMEVRRVGVEAVEGEADVLLLMKDAAFVPVEVKRTSTGFSSSEVSKLDTLTAALNAPWSAVAACQYGGEVVPEFLALEARGASSARSRVLLSYDALLDPYPVWSLGSDPFEWKPLSAEEISARESMFVNQLAAQFDEGPFDWFAETMLRKPSIPSPVVPNEV